MDVVPVGLHIADMRECGGGEGREIWGDTESLGNSAQKNGRENMREDREIVNGETARSISAIHAF